MRCSPQRCNARSTHSINSCVISKGSSIIAHTSAFDGILTQVRYTESIHACIRAYTVGVIRWSQKAMQRIRTRRMYFSTDWYSLCREPLKHTDIDTIACTSRVLGSISETWFSKFQYVLKLARNT